MQCLIRTFLVLLILFQLSFSIFVAGQGVQVAHPKGTTSAPLGFYEYLPKGYDTDVDNIFPVVIFLHGLGQRGNGSSELENLYNEYSPPVMFKEGKNYPFICISPQYHGFWDIRMVDNMVEYIKSHYRVDPDRIYMTGLSAGGTGVWQYSVAYPEKVAAIAPISGNGNGIEICRIWDVPVWALHGLDDKTVSIFGSISPTNALNNCTPQPAPRAKLTLYEGVEHDAWTRTYDGSAGYDIFSWLLSYKRGAIHKPTFLDPVFQGNKKIKLSWVNNSTKNTHFEIQRSLYPDFQAVTTINLSGQVTEYEDTVEEEDVSYFYRIKATSDLQSSEFSNTISLFIPITPLTPVLQEPEVIGLSKIKLHWEDQNTEDINFVLERAESIDFSDAIIIPLGEHNFFIDELQKEGATYFYRIKAVSEKYESEYSNVITYNFLVTGINDGSNNKNLVVYPNPAAEKISLALTDAYFGKIAIRLKDLTGKEVYHHVLQKNDFIIYNEIDLALLKPGIYFLEIVHKDGKYLKKVFKPSQM